MKRILVLSDSHGNVNNMVTAVGRLHPDMIIHLGDCWADAEQLHRKFPSRHNAPPPCKMGIKIARHFCRA